MQEEEMVDITRVCRKYITLYNILLFPENIKYEIIEGESMKGDAHKLPFQGHLAAGDQKDTLEVYL